MGKHKANPPLLFLKFFRSYCDPKMHDYIEGDLMEAYHARLQKHGKRKADLKFIIDVLLLFRPGIIRSQPQYTFNSSTMIRSYFKTSWRNLLRSKLHSALNIIGLTFGIVCFLLIGLYVFDELTFDRQHVNAERIYRVIEHKTVGGESTIIAAAGYKLAEESKNSIPEVESTTRMIRQGRANLVDPENPVPFQETVTVADEHFFQIFDFPLIQGDRRTALKEPASIVVDEDLAMRIFKSTDVMGKHVQFSHLSFPLKITGILRKLPPNSSFNFNCVMSESSFYNSDSFREVMAEDWVSNSFSVFALLAPDANTDSVSSKITRLVLSNYVPEKEGTKLSYSLQPLKDIHLKSEHIFDGARNSNVEAMPQGNPLYITIFSFAAFFVLLIAGINYANLTTARASGRVKEIGVRKAIGAMRSNLIGQFLFESWLTTVIAFALAIIVVNLVLPPFNQFAHKELSLFSVRYTFWLYAIGAIVLIGFLSGSYSALLLSRLKPVSLLKGLKLQNMGDLSVRKVLVVFQFTISIVMIIGTIVLLLQVNYLNNTELGFNKDLMVVIDVNTGAARSNFEVVKDQMSKIASVKSVSVSSRVPGEWKAFRTVKMRAEGSSDEPGIAFLIGADKDFLRTFEVPLLEGRNFQEDYDSMSIIINETAAKMLNITEASEQTVEIPERLLGGYFITLDVPFKPRVIGIVKDFHFQSLHDKIQPLVLAYNNNPIHDIDYYSVRIAPTDISATLARLQAIMVKNDADDPFEYHFLDDQLALFYIEDERRQTILGWTALATIFIACLGLFGLATYATEQRVKEIGVRKVLGATVPGLVSLLSRDFLKLVLIANVIAFPIAWWATNQWLQQYAYHIEVEWWVFLLAGTLATGIALLTISSQAVKTAVANPVKSLRSE